MIIRVVWVDYTEKDGELVTRIAGRDSNGNRQIRHVSGKPPYIFVPEVEKLPPEAKSKVREVYKGYESYDGRNLKKLVLDHPQSTNDVTPFFSWTGEADVPFYRRCAVDGLIGYIDVPAKRNIDFSDIDCNPSVDSPIDPRILLFDIEVRVGDSGIGQMMEDVDMPIICLSLWDSSSDEYTVIVLDEEGKISGDEIRNHLKDHWGDEYKRYAEADLSAIRCDTEEALLRNFSKKVQEYRPDIVSGWNCVSFDESYILKRMVELDVNPHDLSDVGGMSHRQLASDRTDVVARAVDGLPFFDMMEAYKDLEFHELRSKALDYVAEEELGVGKIQGISINDAYENDRSRLVAYNVIDTQLCAAIDRHAGVIDFFLELAELCSIPIYDSPVPMRRVDGYLLSNREDDEILPSVTEKSLEENAGALVFDPPEGIHEWVAVLDLASLYPSIIITLNISPETMAEDGEIICPDVPEPEETEGKISESDIAWSGPEIAATSVSEEGFIPKYLKQLFSVRDEKKALRDRFSPSDAQYGVFDNQQYSVKVLQNSMYGVMASDYWRLSAPGLADMVTRMGRYVIWKSGEIIEGEGYEVLLGDTDSIGISLSKMGDIEEAITKSLEIEDVLNERMDEIADDIGIDTHPYLSDVHHGKPGRHMFEFEAEKIYEKMLSGGKKKRYAGLKRWVR